MQLKKGGKDMFQKGDRGFWLGKKLSKEHRRKLGLSHRGKKLSEKHKKKIGMANTGKIVSVETGKKLSISLYRYYRTHSSPNLGVTKSEETKKRMSLAQKGKIISTETKIKISNTLKKRNIELNKNKIVIIKEKRPHSGWHHSEETKLKISSTNKGKPGLKREKHPNWNNGITTLNKLIRSTDLYIKWRSDIFERDNWTCQICHKTGCYIEAHHKKPLNLMNQ
jgi:hypothetical protein